MVFWGGRLAGEGWGCVPFSWLLTGCLALPRPCPETLELLLVLWHKSPGPSPSKCEFFGGIHMACESHRLENYNCVWRIGNCLQIRCWGPQSPNDMARGGLEADR